MRTEADAVIVGGGIIGVSVAFYLARENFGRILLIEKEPLLGTGATCKAAGGIRAQFSDRTNIQMSMLSEQVFARFKVETDHEALFDQVGYLFLLEDDEDIVRFKEAYKLQRSLNLDVALLKPEEIAQYAPHASLDGIKLATFCHSDGLGDPAEFLTGYEKGARRLGVEISTETEAIGLQLQGNRVVGVKTNQGDINCRHVIDCAGPLSKFLGKLAGVEVRVEPVRRQIVTTGPLSFIKPFFPMVVDVKSGLYCHKESKGMLLGWADPAVPPSTDISIDPNYTDAILEKALARIPQLEEAEIANQWAGLYEVTPDHRSIIGPDPQVEGFFHVTGFSGHGFMHAPAAGIVAAQMLCGREPQIDIASLSPKRFYTGEISVETNVI
jgi:sarcosine oxidase subunit beta